MKTKLTTAIIALLALTLTGCENSNDRKGVSTSNSLETVEYNGHRYIMYQGYNRGGITHDPDCPCMGKGGSRD